jgi:hypothetical protein
MDLNSALLATSTGASISGSKISAHAAVTSAAAESNAQAVTVPRGAVAVFISSQDNKDYAWSVYDSGTSAPAKDAASAMYVIQGTGTASLGHLWQRLDLDPYDPPALFLEETSGADTTLHVMFLTL